MSIRVRLGLWYGGMFALALLLLSLLLYVVMERHLEGMVKDAVSNRAGHLVTAIQSANPKARPGSALVTPPLDAFEAPEAYVQILAPDGTVLDRTSNLADRSLPLPQGVPRSSEYRVPLDDADVKVLLVPVEIDARTRVWVQVAASYRQRDLVMDRLRVALLAGGAGAAIVVGLLSAALAARALRPVSEMTETARAIALSKGFSRRLGGGSSGDELGKLAQTFNEMLASLEGAYAAQQRFTADASHELRAPLTAIRGNLDLLHRIKEMPEDERGEVLDRVRREMERLSRLVNDLLSLARADAGQALDARPLDMDALVMDAYRQAVVMADGVEVSLDQLEPAVVVGDADRLKELLLILVDNALRYTPKGGRVALGLKAAAPWIAVSVEDTGIGIDRADILHIFDRFWRADKARSRIREGTGLGLAIGRWIVERHGGELLVDSILGEGTVFTVHLPPSS